MKLSPIPLLFLAALALPAAAGDSHFTYVDVGTLPGGSASVAYGLNDSNQVVGWSTIPACTTANGFECRRAYVWQNGAITDLGKLPADEDGFARSINDNGLIVGTSESNVVAGSGTYHAVSWTNGAISALPDLGNGTSFARDVNDSGLIVGHAVDPSVSRDRAVTWQSGVVTNVGSSEGHSYNRVQGVNEAGSMVGFAWNLFQPNDSVVFDGSKWATIGGFGQFQNAEASDLNDTGMVVGLQAFPSGSWHAAAWIFGQPEALDLGTLSGLDTGEMYGVNDAGMAVGSSYDSGLPGQNRAILWDGTTLHDLNDLVTVPPGAVLYEARDINEHGDVAGTALIDGNFRAFLLVRDTLASQTTELSLASGGQQDLALEGGSLRAGWFYWVFGSATGTSPGLDFGGGVVLPLNFDAYFNLTLTKPGLGAFGDFIGQLDGAGDAAATLTIPSGVDPSLAGVTLHHAFLAAEVLGFADFASNPVAVTLAP